MIFIDFETYSEADLRVVGAQNYMEHESTKILVLGWAVDDEEPTSWMPHHPELSRMSLRETLNVFNDIPHGEFFAAHNAAFDLLAMDLAHYEHGLPIPAVSEWIDTASVARINGYPGGLADLCLAIGAEHKKNPQGGRLITKCCTPKGAKPTTKDFEELRDYCEQDIRSMRSAYRMMRSMSETEHEDWLITQEINQRGVPVSLEDISTAIEAAEAISERINNGLTELTDGAVRKATQVTRAKRWLGVDGSLDKAARRALVEGDISDQHFEVIDLIDEGNLTSIAKYEKLRGMASWEDHRVRGALVHAGAGQTQRYSSRGVQLHNFRRDAYAPIDARERLDSLNADTDMSELAKLLRNVIVPAKGNVLVVGDWSSIEARVLPWLAGSEKMLDVFRAGEDVYERTAKWMGVDRQVGKVAVLACGFGGSVGAFNRMAEIYGVEVRDPKGIVTRWRAANSWAGDFWRDVEHAAMKAMQHPDQDFYAGEKLIYRYVPHARTLTATLPDGTILHYPQPKILSGQYGWDIEVLKASIRPKAGKPWPRQRLWYGLLVENATQATAAAVLRETLRDEYIASHCIMHVHDEIVLEVPKAEAQWAAAYLASAMSTASEWAEGLPLKAQPVIMERYGKAA